MLCDSSDYPMCTRVPTEGGKIQIASVCCYNKMPSCVVSHPHTFILTFPHILTTHTVTLTPSQEIVVGSNMDKIYIVMDYVEHDLKALMETMQTNFLESEVWL